MHEHRVREIRTGRVGKDEHALVVAVQVCPIGTVRREDEVRVSTDVDIVGDGNGAPFLSPFSVALWGGFWRLVLGGRTSKSLQRGA